MATMCRGAKLKRKHSAGTISAADKKARVEPPAGLVAEARLCTHCQDIDFDEIFRTETKASGMTFVSGKLVQALGHVNPRTSAVQELSLSGETTTCDLCHFFRSLAVDHKTPYLELHAYSAQAAFRLPRGVVPDSGMLAVVPGKREKMSRSQLLPPRRSGKMIMHCHDSSDRIAGRQIAPAIDFELIRSWLEFCDAHHDEEHCSYDGIGSMPGFRVIDCEARKVVPWLEIHKSGKFAALSYVWGNSTKKYDFTKADGSLPDDIPRVVADAMMATKELGFKHIWIDRYCIPQDNFKDKHTQIRNMNLIYGSSVVTLVAAAGEDPSYGLPGVGSTPRLKQLSVRIGSRTLVATNHNAQEQVQQSRWNERAWTYQEALLSKRRLVFTDRLVYFQCGAMHCVETLKAPLEILHTRNCRRMRDSVNMSMAWPLRGIGKHPADLENRIVEYSRRKLTYSADSLQAFQGILSRFKAMKHPVPNICGIPLFQTHDNNITSSLIVGLSWRIILRRSSLIQKTHQWRRPGFPSWSWVGWDLADMSRSVIGFTWHFDTSSVSQYDVSIFENKTVLKPVRAIAEIRMRFNDGTVLPWHDASDRIMAMAASGDAPEELLITGFTADVRLTEKDKPKWAHMCYMAADGSYFGQQFGYHAADDQAHSLSRCADAFGADLRPDDNADGLFYHLRLILLGYAQKTRRLFPWKFAMVMVVHRPKNSDRYERLTLVIDTCTGKWHEHGDMRRGVAPEGWTWCETRIA